MARNKAPRKNRTAPRNAPPPQTVMDRARDELFRAIRQCGVLGAERDEQIEWMADTLTFMAERHPELTPEELHRLRETGLRFCQPVIPHGTEHTALGHGGATAA